MLAELESAFVSLSVAGGVSPSLITRKNCVCVVLEASRTKGLAASKAVFVEFEDTLSVEFTVDRTRDARRSLSSLLTFLRDT